MMTQGMKNALIDAGTNRVGAKPYGPAGVLADLRHAGLTGPTGGLTRKGSIARERAVSEAQAKAFG
jgi:hypothetical protein